MACSDNNVYWYKYLIRFLIVGFGDYYPKTHIGRFLVILSAFWGVFIVSMSIVSLSNLKKLASNEERVIFYLF